MKTEEEIEQYKAGFRQKYVMQQELELLKKSGSAVRQITLENFDQKKLLRVHKERASAFAQEAARAKMILNVMEDRF